jgi:hypothetical protein
MFVRTAPQQTRHIDGYLVQTASRDAIEYIDDKRRASIYVEFAEGPVGTMAALYAQTLRVTYPDGHQGPGANERELILSRISEGLRFLGTIPEFV